MSVHRRKWPCKAAAFITGEDFWRGIVAIIGFPAYSGKSDRARKRWFGFAFPWIWQVRRRRPCCRKCYRLIRTELLVQLVSEHAARVSRASSPRC